MSTEIIKVPDIGGAEGVEVIEICVAVGDAVEAEDSLVVLESDKASMEVPSPMAGTVTAINIADGDSLSEGDVILELSTEGQAEGQAEDVSAPAESSPASPSEQASAPVVPAASPADPAPVQATAASSIETIKIPDIGGADNVDVIEVCVAVGDEVAEGDSLIVLETDKASMEVPSPVAGKVITLSMNEGDTASEGADILQMEVSGAQVGEATPAAAPVPTPAVASESAASAVSRAVKPPEIQASVAPVADPAGASPLGGAADVYAGPAVRRLAREMGVGLAKIKGSGPKGRISKDDLKAFVKTQLTNKSSGVAGAGIPPIAEIDFSKFGEINIEPLTKIHKLTAANMLRNWLNVPHVTQFDEVDISDMEDFRQSLKAEAEKRGVKITPLPFLLKAVAKALTEHPKLNASLHADGEHMVYKNYVHIGMAVDTPAGLMVPVLRDVDTKSIWELAEETASLAQKAKNRKLSPAQMQGSCFTISSLGGIGGQGFTPIVNAPEVGILGVSKLAVKPVWNGSEFVPRKMLPVSLSYDHRAINGVDAGRFLTYLGELLADIRKLVL